MSVKHQKTPSEQEVWEEMGRKRRLPRAEQEKFDDEVFGPASVPRTRVAQPIPSNSDVHHRTSSNSVTGSEVARGVNPRSTQMSATGNGYIKAQSGVSPSTSVSNSSSHPDINIILIQSSQYRQSRYPQDHSPSHGTPRVSDFVRQMTTRENDTLPPSSGGNTAVLADNGHQAHMGPPLYRKVLPKPGTADRARAINNTGVFGQTPALMNPPVQAQIPGSGMYPSSSSWSTPPSNTINPSLLSVSGGPGSDNTDSLFKDDEDEESDNGEEEDVKPEPAARKRKVKKGEVNNPDVSP